MHTDTITSDHKAPVWGLIFASAIAGGAGAFSMAPHFYWPLLMIGLAVLFLAQYNLTKCLHSFVSGWVFGFFYFALSLSWIGNALLVEGNEYAWAWPLAITGLPALLAFFPAIACYLAKRFYASGPLRFYLGLAGLLTLSEFARGFAFTGFPWNLYGYTWGTILEMLQIVHLGNIYWLTSLTLFWGLGLGYVALQQKRGIIALLIILLSVGAVYLYGDWRLQNIPKAEKTNISFKLVQPNVDQAEKWQRNEMPNHFSRLLQLSTPDGTESETTIIIWPETATNSLFLNNEFALSQIRDVMQSYPEDAYLITGALLHNKEGLPSNSLLVLDKNADIIHRYNKSHLVPFGEYIPFQDWIPLDTVSGFSGFQRGEGRETIQLSDDFSFSPLICYEIIFPSRVIHHDNKPDVIINITNDAWYGISAGPHQHYLMAKMRAIEESRPVVRVANTGFSGIFDSYGFEKSHLGIFQAANTNQNHTKLFTPSHDKNYINLYFFLLNSLFMLVLLIKLEKNNILDDKK